MRSCIAFLLLFSAIAFAADPPAAKTAGTSQLPVRRVVLYKNGVGYFEHTGRVSGDHELGISFTTAQLNDVLKSLTAVDLGEGRVTGIRYDSIAPLDVRLRGLRLSLGQQPTQADFLNALRGSRVEVRSGVATAVGRVLSIEKRTHEVPKTDDVVETTELSLITDNGELQSFTLGPSTSVKVLDPELNHDVDRYLGLVESSRSNDLRRMVISTSGKGERDLFVSYISEVPIWKSTYRIVLRKDAQPLLQGWAIVDNTVGEDWNNVQLSLVAGSPQSFVQDISQPLYARRPVVGLPQATMLAPQSHEGTMERKDLPGPPPPMAATMPGAVGANSLDGRGAGAIFKSRNARLQAGAAAEAMEVTDSAAKADMLQAAMANLEAEASGGAAGDLFEYDLKQRISIGKNQSALVPIINARVDAKKVTLWNSESHRALRALWITNTSGLTLDAGTFNIVEDGTFSGEGLVQAVKPAERRLISYAADTAVRVTSREDSRIEPATRVRIARGVLWITREERQTHDYVVHNSDTTQREVVVEYPARAGWKLADGLKPEESSSSFHRFEVKVAPDATETLAVKEVRPETTTVSLMNLTPDQIQLFVQERTISPDVEQALRAILAKKNALSGFDQELQSRQQEIESITADQSRVRENMKALRGAAEEKLLLQRYTRQLNSQEDRLNALRSQMEQIRQKRTLAGSELDRLIMDVSFQQGS